MRSEPEHGRDPVLVTGAHGMLGSAVVRRLRSQEVPVLAVARSGPGPGTQPVPGIVLDLISTGTDRLSGLPALAGVIHCAAELPATHTSDAARTAADANERMDRAIVDLCEDRSLRLVYVSSASVYGETGPVPVHETSPLQPPGPYAAAKRASEERIDRVLESFCALRPTAIYGPGQRAMTVLRLFLERATANEPIQYHGSGSREQDFVHADDVAEACVAAWATATGRSVVNVCSGAPVTRRELAELVVAAVPGSASRTSGSGRPDPQEGARARYDKSRAHELLGWEPRISLTQGVADWCGQLRAVAAR
jgi:UDP-glucose 4-epimerase